MDPEAEERKKRQTRVTLVTMGAAAFVLAIIATAGGNDGTKVPSPAVTLCRIVDGALVCGQGLSDPTGYPALDWRTALPLLPDVPSVPAPPAERQRPATPAPERVPPRGAVHARPLPLNAAAAGALS